MPGLAQLLVRLRARSRLFASVGLVALVLLQVSMASHQFEHVADDPTQTCRVCVQHDRLDDGLSTAESAQLEPQPTIFATPGHAAPAPTLVATPFRARAPPTLS